MKLNKTKISSLILTFFIICLLSIPKTTHGQAIKSILQNPHKYDGKIVQVAGKVISPHFKESNTNNAYTMFKLTDSQGNIVSVFSSGTLSIKENDMVKVMGIYQETKRVSPQYGFLNAIDASKGNVEKIR